MGFGDYYQVKLQEVKDISEDDKPSNRYDYHPTNNVMLDADYTKAEEYIQNIQSQSTGLTQYDHIRNHLRNHIYDNQWVMKDFQNGDLPDYLSEIITNQPTPPPIEETPVEETTTQEVESSQIQARMQLS